MFGCRDRRTSNDLTDRPTHRTPPLLAPPLPVLHTGTNTRTLGEYGTTKTTQSECGDTHGCSSSVTHLILEAGSKPGEQQLHLVAHFLLQETDRPSDVSGGPVSASQLGGEHSRSKGAPDGRHTGSFQSSARRRQRLLLKEANYFPEFNNVSIGFPTVWNKKENKIPHLCFIV